VTRRLALVLGLVGALVLSAGCGSDEDLAEFELTAASGDARARVWIPINEPRSAGTWRAEVEWGDGVSDIEGVERDGMLSGVWLAELTGNAEPELVVATTSAGSGSYGVAHVYARGPDGLAQIELADLTEEQRVGYMGHDEFAVEEGELHREFPIYADDDVNAEPSGGTARFTYDFDEGLWLPVTSP
jgi:hypothetical protein